MSLPEFEITISKTGKVKVHVKGVKGQKCIEMADLLKEIVGSEEDRELTADYYAPDVKVKINAQARVKDSSVD
ncbi:MAG: DUF2997 domain-containing protein [Anaerolineales bacterium]